MPAARSAAACGYAPAARCHGTLATYFGPPGACASTTWFSPKGCVRPPINRLVRVIGQIKSLSTRSGILSCKSRPTIDARLTSLDAERQNRTRCLASSSSNEHRPSTLTNAPQSSNAERNGDPQARKRWRSFGDYSSVASNARHIGAFGKANASRVRASLRRGAEPEGLFPNSAKMLAPGSSG
jgi:hypothetical protein